MQSPLYKRRDEGYNKWMGAWKVRKREGPWNHEPQGSHLDSKRQPPLRKGVESFLNHQKERCKSNSLASQEKIISDLF